MRRSSPQDLSEQLRQAAQEIKDNALAEAHRAVQAELDQARAERRATQAQLDQAQSSRVRSDLVQQVRQIDFKISELERALEKIDVKTTTTVDRPPPTRYTETRAPDPPTRRMTPFDPTEIVATSLGILFVAFPLTLAIVRFIWKRSTSAPAPVMTVEQTRRFDRLEQSVDAIAIEIERISENQRYLTRVLSESKQTSKIGS
jgi:multidrug efflux pump subunit AcrA (membrane-fusion protein)